MRVLVVSSDTQIGAAAAAVLSKNGHSVEPVRDPQEAAEKLLNKIDRFDAVVASSEPETGIQSIYWFNRENGDALPFLILQTDDREEGPIFGKDCIEIDCGPSMSDMLLYELDRAHQKRKLHQYHSKG